MHFITESKPNLQETVCIVRFLHLAFYNYGSLAVKTNSSVCFARLMICSSGFIIRRNKILRRGAKVESTSSTKFLLHFLTLSVQNTSLIDICHELDTALKFVIKRVDEGKISNHKFAGLYWIGDLTSAGICGFPQE